MSMICRVCIGYFDPLEVAFRPRVIHQPITQEQLARLEQLCRDVFSLDMRLAEYLHDGGYLEFVSGNVGEAVYQVSAIGWEAFRMTSMDCAHHAVLFSNSADIPQWCDSQSVFHRQLIETVQNHLRRVNGDRPTSIS
ncbi:hypothetical protein [Gemmata sp.]|uniref:hypothetical protein n=1 Tax=Gemmata sp. TaxID=1914242 RepID=UPI003F6FD784